MTYYQLFVITNNICQITFTNKVQATKMRVNQCYYTTATNNNRFALVRISSWFASHFFENYEYTSMIMLGRVVLTDVQYTSDIQHWDIIKSTKDTVSTHYLEIFINGDPTNTDISEENPLYIEICYE